MIACALNGSTAAEMNNESLCLLIDVDLGCPDIDACPEVDGICPDIDLGCDNCPDSCGGQEPDSCGGGGGADQCNANSLPPVVIPR